MTRRVGLLAALLALWGQLLLGTVVPHPAAAETLAQLLADPSAICHAEGGPAGPGHTGHHDPDCPLCPACATLLHAVPLPVRPPAMPGRRAGLIGIAAPARPCLLAPPARRLAAEPRGPPARA